MGRIGKKGSKGGPFDGMTSYFEIWPQWLDFEWEEEDLGPKPVIEARWPGGRVWRPEHAAAKYLHDECHDGRVVRAELVAESFELEVTDYNFDRMAWAYAVETKSVGGGLPRFLLVFQFEGVKEVVVWHPEEDGRLRRVRAVYRKALGQGEEFYRDHVVRWDEGGITALFCMGKPFRYPFSRYYLPGCLSQWSYRAHEMVIGVDAAGLSVVEKQRESWIQHFGEDSLWIVEAFQEERTRGVGQEGFEWFEEWVRRQLLQR